MMFGLITTYLRATNIIDDDIAMMLFFLAFVELVFELMIIGAAL